MLIPVPAVFVGCASPGQPKPPSLHLPQTVTDLVATRTGSEIELHWTTPSSTTDNVPVPSQISAAICRLQVTSTAAKHGSCTSVKQLPVHPGFSEAVDDLPGDLTTGPVGLLSYRIEILNAAGRSAGRSPDAFAASGAAPPMVAGLTATGVRGGVRLTWAVAAEAGSGTVVELDRTEPGTPAAASPVAVPPSRRHTPELAADERHRSEVHLRASDPGRPDAGGTIDRSAKKGVTYRYTAQRVQIAVVAGHSVVLRSAASAPSMVTLLDTFPPQPPSGLETAVSGTAELPSVDLSWQPGAEPDLAGYNVYRADSGDGAADGSWRRLNATPVQVPAYSDATVRAGTRYAYRVTAVDNSGNESAPGPEVQETPGNR